jgi:hypothetical protein
MTLLVFPAGEVILPILVCKTLYLICPSMLCSHTLKFIHVLSRVILMSNSSVG